MNVVPEYVSTSNCSAVVGVAGITMSSSYNGLPSSSLSFKTSNVIEEDSVESTVTEKEAFIVHKPTAEKEESHSVLPPWWVILSVLAIIFAAFNDTIEAGRRK